jgi:hypothetical protein
LWFVFRVLCALGVAAVRLFTAEAQRARKGFLLCAPGVAAVAVFHHSDAAFAEEDSLAHHAPACCATHPLWFVFRVLCALGVAAVRFCSEVMKVKETGWG